MQRLLQGPSLSPPHPRYRADNRHSPRAAQKHRIIELSEFERQRLANAKVNGSSRNVFVPHHPEPPASQQVNPTGSYAVVLYQDLAPSDPTMALAPGLANDPHSEGGAHLHQGAMSKLRGTLVTKEQQVRRLESHIALHCSSNKPLESHVDGYCKVLDEIADWHPALINIFGTVKHYMKELVESIGKSRAEHEITLNAAVKAAVEAREKFFEDRFVEVLKKKRALEKHVAELQRKNDQLCRSRDEELMKAKQEVVEAIRRADSESEGAKSLRGLINTIFTVSNELKDRVLLLENIIEENKLPIPPASREVIQITGSKAEIANEDSTGTTKLLSEHDAAHNKRRLQQQAGIEFVDASRRELEQCRLHTQSALVYCASETQSSYKIMVSSLTQENATLKLQVKELTDKMSVIQRDVYGLRFGDVALWQDRGKHKDAREESVRTPNTNQTSPQGMMLENFSELQYTARSAPRVPLEENDGDSVMNDRSLLTPRPKIPFDAQATLGIDLFRPTADIANQLLCVANNLKAQLGEMMVKYRRFSAAAAWMEQRTLNFIAESTIKDEPALLSTVPSANWDTVHHFLRTDVHPTVLNMSWSCQLTAMVVMRFFESFEEMSFVARRERDQKMIAPRVFQQYERRQHPMAFLDATSDDLLDEGRPVPIGYVVTAFLRAELIAHMDPSDKEHKMTAEMLGANAIKPRFTYRREDRAMELELAKVSHNLWHSVQKYRGEHPLCQMFIDVLDGRLPHQIYNITKNAIEIVFWRLRKYDVNHSGAVLYKHITAAILYLLQDQGPNVWRQALYAAALTFESRGVPLVGGVPIKHLMNLECHRQIQRSFVGDLSLGSASTASNLQHIDLAATLSATATAAESLQSTVANEKGTVNDSVFSPTMRSLELSGGSLFVRHLRKIIVDIYQRAVRQVEEVMAPFVFESILVEGLLLLRIQDAKNAVAPIDKDIRDKHHQEATCDNGFGWDSVVSTIFDKLPRLNSSVHYRYDATAATSIDPPKEVKKKKASRRKSSVATTDKSLSDAVVVGSPLPVEDKELVEWYMFCAILRTTPWPIYGRAFRPIQELQAQKQKEKNSAT